MLRSPAWNILPFLLYDGSTAADCSFSNDVQSLDTLILDLCTLGNALHHLATEYNTHAHELVCLAASSFENEARLRPSALQRLNFCPDHEFSFLAGNDLVSLARSAFQLHHSFAATGSPEGSFPLCPLFPDFRHLAAEIRAEFAGSECAIHPHHVLPRSPAARLLRNERAALRSVMVSFARDIRSLACTQRCAAVLLMPVLSEVHIYRAAHLRCGSL